MATQQILGGRYELQRRIGVGGMAVVYLAHDLRLDRDVAVKVLAAGITVDPTFVERFRREARAAAALSSPNVVTVFDWGEAPDEGGDSLYYLVMEYVPGPNLKERIQRDGPLEESVALALAGGIAAALDVAHRRGLIHRDIKPQNVLIDADGHAKVVDFGIAYLEGLTHLTQTNAVSGTAHYISPEQAAGRPIDARTDIYSLGVVMYEMLSGRVPFDGASLIDVALHHVQDDPVPLRSIRPEVSSATAEIVATALQKDPARRFASATALRTAIIRAQDEVASRGVPTEVMKIPAAASEPDRDEPKKVQGEPSAPVHPTVKLGTHTPGRRPRVRAKDRRPAWWVLAIPLALIALVVGLGIHAIAGGSSPSAPNSRQAAAPSPTPKAHKAGTPTASPTVAPPTARPTSPASAPPVSAPVPTTTPVPVQPSPTTPSSTNTPVPPTNVPTTVPTTTPVPAPGPPVVAGESPGATSPAGAVALFYQDVTHHQYGAAAGLWTDAMKRTWPPETNINSRFDATASISVRVTGVTQSANSAAVDVTLTELKQDGSTDGYVGTWYLVRSPSGWMLNSVSLAPRSA